MISLELEAGWAPSCELGLYRPASVSGNRAQGWDLDEGAGIQSAKCPEQLCAWEGRGFPQHGGWVSSLGFTPHHPDGCWPVLSCLLCAGRGGGCW